jgi:predicted NodU family carbamoyl transferase
LYSVFTYFTGSKVNSGDCKLMGLTPYGEPKYADVPAAGSSADAYNIAAREAGLIVARRNVTRVARLDALIERMGVARAAMLGIVHTGG